MNILLYGFFVKHFCFIGGWGRAVWYLWGIEGGI